MIIALIIAGSLSTSTSRPSHSGHHFPGTGKLPPQKGLPDPFLVPGGKCIASAGKWIKHRPYLKAMLEYCMYGRIPPLPEKIKVRKTGQSDK